MRAMDLFKSKFSGNSLKAPKSSQKLSILYLQTRRSMALAAIESDAGTVLSEGPERLPAQAGGGGRRVCGADPPEEGREWSDQEL